MINFSLSPSFFKLSLINPLYKNKGKRTSPDSDRPIAGLHYLCKLFEKIFFNFLLFETITKINPKQHGLRSGHSCNSSTFVFSQSILDSVDKRNGRMLALHVDFIKALFSFNDVKS